LTVYDWHSRTPRAISQSLNSRCCSFRLSRNCVLKAFHFRRSANPPRFRPFFFFPATSARKRSGTLKHLSGLPRRRPLCLPPLPLQSISDGVERKPFFPPVLFPPFASFCHPPVELNPNALIPASPTPSFLWRTCFFPPPFFGFFRPSFPIVLPNNLTSRALTPAPPPGRLHYFPPPGVFLPPHDPTEI